MTSLEFRAALQELGWSQVHLAGKLGRHINVVSRWATGELSVPKYAVAYLGVHLKLRALMKQIGELVA